LICGIKTEAPCRKLRDMRWLLRFMINGFVFQGAGYGTGLYAGMYSPTRKGRLNNDGPRYP